MIKPGGLRALLAQQKPGAEVSGNVVALGRAAGASPFGLDVRAAEPAQPVGAALGAEHAELLAQLDDMVSRASRQPAAEDDTSETTPTQATEGDALAPEPLPATTTPVAATAAVQVQRSVAPRVTALSYADGIDLVNRTHFTAPLSGEVTVWREGIDHETGLRTVTPVSTNSIRLEFAPYTVNVATPSGVRSMPLAEVWLRSKHRREYPCGVILQPEGSTPSGCFNLWQGFGVQRKAGDASPMIEHVHMLCSGNAALAEYTLNWFAHCVQRPGSRPEVALVLRGGRGTGKGTVFRIMLLIFGRHGLHITQPKHLVGNFNSHLRTALFLFADECHWPGDKAAEGVLKGLITEPTIAVEMKGRDVFTALNRIKLGMASNNDWVVPAGADERRYFVIDVSKDRSQDHAYFAALNTWIDGDGASIFLDHLLSRDLSGFNVRAVPKTAALDRQKIEGMPAIDRWLLDCLDTAVSPAGDDWTEAAQPVTCEVAAARLDNYCRRSTVRGTRPDARAIGKRLNEIFGCGPAVARRVHATSHRAWTLPGITAARHAAARAFGLTQYVWGQA